MAAAIGSTLPLRSATLPATIQSVCKSVTGCTLAWLALRPGKKTFPERQPFVCCLSVWCERFYVRLGGTVHPSSISRGNNVKSFVRERREG